jgi:hypothetical protein
MNDIPMLSLSNETSRKIDWQTIEDVVGVVAGLQRKAPADTATPEERLSAEDREAARRAFVVVREEFAKTTGWLRITMRWAMVGIIAAVAIAVIGGVLIQVSPWAGLYQLIVCAAAEDIRISAGSSYARTHSRTLRARLGTLHH